MFHVKHSDDKKTPAAQTRAAGEGGEECGGQARPRRGM